MEGGGIFDQANVVGHMSKQTSVFKINHKPLTYSVPFMVIILPLKVENVNKFGKNNQTRIYLHKVDNENLSDKK